jgi:hypothetical protein
MDKNFGTARQRFNTAYDALFDLTATYPTAKREQSGACGVWSPKQIIAHFVGWVNKGREIYSAYAAGTYQPERIDPDVYNAEQVEQRDHLAWEAIVDELKAAVEALNAQADSVPTESQDKLYIGWMVGLARDCEEHSQEMIDFAATLRLS